MNKTCEYNRYPHTDINVQNLDWIIEQINDLNHTVDVFTTLNKLTWAGEWDIGEAYSQWSLVNDLEGNGYVSIVPVPRNVQITNTDYWQPIGKYNTLYEAFNARIELLENDNTINKNDIVLLKSKTTKEAIVNIIYPIGSIYMSINDVNPKIFLGGTWEKIENRFLFGCSKEVPIGTIDGEKEHLLTIEEMPQHYHKGLVWATGTPITLHSGDPGSYYGLESSSCGNVDTGIRTLATGESKKHNNMPPYIAVSIWKRTA